MSELTTHVNPATLASNPAFAHGVIIASSPTLYVGGQNGVDARGVMAEGLESQTAQALQNVLAVLSEAGTAPQHVAKLSIHVLAGSDVRAAFAASGSVWGQHPTAITVLQVAGFARPDALVEVDAVAAVPS